MMALSLFDRARASSGAKCDIWIGLAALSGGFGVWATHFIGSLAAAPSVPTGYSVLPVVTSLLCAVALTRAGFKLALGHSSPPRPWLGGAVLGGGIAVADYSGLVALNIAGHVLWSPVLIGVSVVVGAVLGGMAMRATCLDDPGRRFAAACLLIGAVSGVDFMARRAAIFIADPTIGIPAGDLAPADMAVLVAIVSVALLAFSVFSAAIDRRYRRRIEREADLRGLADAAVEGLLVCDGDIIVTANNSLMKLTGYDETDISGKPLDAFIPDAETRVALFRNRDQPIDADLLCKDGSLIPTEMILHSIDFAGRPHAAVAVRDLRDRKKAEQRILYLAHHDALTGLPNRATFNHRLDGEIDAACRGGHKLAVLCLDLDRFKEVNDLFGHVAGDQVLQAVAARATAATAGRYMTARLGSDEFAIIMPDLLDAATAGTLAEQIIDALRQESSRSPEGLVIACSIGIALYPSDGRDRQTLLNQADTALQRAKQEGRGTYRFFEAAMGAQVRERRLMEHDLRQALARHELRLVYQPQTLIQTGKIVGFEALLRWRQPERGEVSPSLFIPIAEESGAILQIGEWALKTACREAASWTSPLRIAVNVSAVQLHSAGFAAMVHETLLQTGLDPQRLELEITETALVRDFERALATLRQLKTLGICIAMDDFGTGYSSLSNLRAFPFDRIKIDSSFVRSIDHNAQSAAIVRAVLGLGRGLNLPIIAEGVETDAELRFLNRESCDEAQGYLLGRPASIESFRALTHEATSPEPASSEASRSASEQAGKAA